MPADLLLIARFALALVFVIAAVAKLADLAAFRATLGEFGVPRQAAGALAIALPALELAIAALLVPTATARAAAAASLVLLLGFCAAIGRAMARGERPDCNCFGRAHSRAVGPGTLARNAALGGVAGLVVAAGAGSGLSTALAEIDAPPLVLVLAAGFLAQAWFSWQLFRQHGRLIERVRALEASAERPAPALTVVHRGNHGPNEDGRRMRVAAS